MDENWIIEARKQVREFFATATEEEIRQIGDRAGYDVYSQPMDPEMLAFEAPVQAAVPEQGGVNIYVIVGTQYPVSTAMHAPPDNTSILTFRR